MATTDPPTDREVRDALRWLDKRHRSRENLARALPFDTTGPMVTGVLNGQKRYGADRRRALVSYQKTLASTAQQVHSAIAFGIQTVQALRKGHTAEDELDRMEKMFDRLHDRLNEATD